MIDRYSYRLSLQGCSWLLRFL